MRAVDIEKLPSVSRPTVHPDGTRAVVALSHPNLAANASVGQLWCVDLDGGSTPQRVSRGFHDRQPQFSPDGLALAFLRGEPGEKPQLHVMVASGGEPVQITEAPLGVSSFLWAPDSASIVFAARVPEPGRYGTVEGLSPAEESPRRQTSLRYRANGVGYSNDRRTQLFHVIAPNLQAAPAVLAAPSLADPTPAKDAAARGIPDARQLTPPQFDHGSFAFSRDSSRVRVVSARHATRDDELRHEIHEHPLASDATSTRLLGAEANLSIEEIATATDDAVLIVAANVGDTGRDFVARNAGLYVLDGGTPQRLTDAESIDLGDGALGALPGGAALALLRTRGSVRLVSIARDGELQVISTEGSDVTGHGTGGSRIVYAFQDAERSGEVTVLDGAEARVLSDFSAGVRAAGVVPARELTVAGQGGYPIHGWVYTPKGVGPHPVLLVIHGGPFSFYSSSLFDEAQVYVDAGYAVVMCNPRGSASYGQAHGRAIRQQMGTLDHDDVMDFLDGALASDPALDSSRLGVMGGSYGGYLTAWVIAHEERFAGAIVERGYLDPEAFIGTSDIGDFFTDEYTGTDPEQMRAQSPQAVVDGVITPTLVMHSEEDYRCPLGQAERYYAALKRRGVPSELLVFPGENHELSRSGQPRHRVERFDAILDWWARYLPVVSG